MGRKRKGREEEEWERKGGSTPKYFSLELPLLRTLTTWNCPHYSPPLLRSISPDSRAHSSKSASSGLSAGTDRWKDRRTDTAPFHRPRSAYLPIIITSYLLLFIFSPVPFILSVPFSPVPSPRHSLQLQSAVDKLHYSQGLL